MMAAILDFARRTKSDFSIPTGRVLEVGSFDVNGSPRSVFQADAEWYHGVDISPGPGVDAVVDGEKLSAHFDAESFDTVVSMECLEHTVRPWIIVEQMKAVLRPGGHLWISTPTYGFPLHRYPIDCFRFGEDAYRLWIFAGMELMRLEHVVDELNQPAIVAVGRK
jgi:SAM-dependent methyltransferase